jgi:hypothetical protein
MNNNAIMNNSINETMNVLCLITRDQNNLNENWLRVCFLRTRDRQGNWDLEYNVYIPNIRQIYNVTFDTKDNGNKFTYYGMEIEKNNGFSRAYLLNETTISNFMRENTLSEYAIINIDTNYFNGILRNS